VSGARCGFAVLPTFSNFRALVHILTKRLQREMKASWAADLAKRTSEDRPR
jgi:hypothetical protein